MKSRPSRLVDVQTAGVPSVLETWAWYQIRKEISSVTHHYFLCIQKCFLYINVTFYLSEYVHVLFLPEDNDENLLCTLAHELFVVVVVVVVIGVSSLQPRRSPTCPDLISVTHVVQGQAPGCLFVLRQMIRVDLLGRRGFRFQPVEHD